MNVIAEQDADGNVSLWVTPDNPSDRIALDVFRRQLESKRGTAVNIHRETHGDCAIVGLKIESFAPEDRQS